MEPEAPTHATHATPAHPPRRALRNVTAAVAAVALASTLVVVAIRPAGDGGRATVWAGETSDTNDPRGTSDEPAEERVVVQAANRPASGGGRFEDYWYPLEPLFVRTTPEGVTIRAYLEDTPDEEPSSPGWTPPPWCYPTATVQSALSTDVTVGRGASWVYAEPAGGLSAAYGHIGLREGRPVWWVSVQAPGAEGVRAMFPGGGRDQMDTTDGVAVLAYPAEPRVARSQDEYWETSAALDQAEITVEAFDAAGTVVASRDLSPYAEEFDDRCEAPPAPPPTLPAPGPDQPADVDAARTAVTQAYADAFTGTTAADLRVAAIERGAEFAEVLASLATGGFAQYVESATVNVRDIVFLSATEAAVAYDISVENLTDINGNTGRAWFVEGRWKVAYDTVCEVLELLGACPARDSASEETVDE